MTPDVPGAAHTFVVRARREHGGRLTGVVEQVRTGAKRQFDGSDTIGEVIEHLLDSDDRKPLAQ